jgi:hypothetical protein
MTTPGAGYYPAKDKPGYERWWDGTRWTEQTRPLQAAMTPPAAPWIVPPKQTTTGNWFGRHKALSILGAVLLVLGIVGAIAGGTSTPSSDTSSTSSNDGTTGADPPVDTSNDTDATKLELQVAVQSVQAGIQLLQSSGQASDVASFSGLVKQAKDYLHDASLAMVSHIGNPLKSEREEAWYAADQLSSAMGKLRNYLDDNKPSTLSDFMSQYQQGVTYWNEAITKIFDRAGHAKPPLL